MPDERPCNLCGLRPAGSREHLPGVAAANAGPVTVTYFQPATPESRDLQRRDRVEAEGFYVRTLCRHCNSRTGGHYGTAYKEFVEQFSTSGILDAGERRTWISLRDIQPLRVIKQMTSMFIAVQGSFGPGAWIPERQFVLRRDAKLASPSLHFYLYRNTSAQGRITTFVSLMSAYHRWEPFALCEISWPPLGVVIATEQHSLLASMKEITDWGSYSFRDRANLQFSVPQHRIATHWPLGFGTAAEAHAWSARDGVMVALASGVGDDDRAQLSVLTQQGRRPS